MVLDPEITLRCIVGIQIIHVIAGYDCLELFTVGGKVDPAMKKSERHVRFGGLKGFCVKVAFLTIPGIAILAGLEIVARLYVWKNYGDQNHGINWRFEYEPYVLTKTNTKIHTDYPPKGDAFRIVVVGGSTASLVPDDAIAQAQKALRTAPNHGVALSVLWKAYHAKGMHEEALAAVKAIYAWYGLKEVEDALTRA